MPPPYIKPKGLFLNSTQANCSIYESGRMVYECLKISESYEIDYQEIDERHRKVPGNYDFYAFNYHHFTMAWLDTTSLRRLRAPKITFVLETLPDDPFVLCPNNVFDAYCALDPTMRSPDRRVYGFPRPLESAPKSQAAPNESEVPVIGTFGFATSGKGFERVVEAVNQEFERAVIRINIPLAAYADEKRIYAERLSANCQRLAKDGVQVFVTHDYMSKDELIAWCQRNTLNCFLYDRNMPGLSATTDQAISSGRPLAVSANQTFRHIIAYLQPYPLQSLRESIASSGGQVLRMQKDWSPGNFALCFEKVLRDLGLFSSSVRTDTPSGTLVLSRISPTDIFLARCRRLSRKIGFRDFVPPILSKAAHRLRRQKSKAPRQSIIPFAHKALDSYGQHQEDLLIDLLLGVKKEGFYLDVGANDPVSNSNTLRFYRRGWSGINIEPGREPFERLNALRPNDLNLNVAIGPARGKRTFFRVVDDSTLSSIDSQTALRMARQVGSTVQLEEVETLTLSDVFKEYVEGRHVDFLSVDAEGHDLEVLNSNDWNKHRPTLVLVEINNQHEEITRFLSSQNYLLIFNNLVNGLYVDKHTGDPRIRETCSGGFLI